MRSCEYTLQPSQKPFELAVMFVRLYRSLDALVGRDDAVAGSWLKNRNTALYGEPIALIQTVPGLMNVIQYLDACRAVV
jgi:antitoxin Xre/MbcA/ParS-like protein